MRWAERVCALVIGLFSLLATPSDAGPLDLDGQRAVREVGTAALFFADPSGAITLAEARTALGDDLFEPVDNAHFDAGYSITPYWIAIPVKNSGAREAAHILSSNVPYVPALSVTLLREDATVEPLLDKRLDTPWRSDQYLGQSVVSAEFLLDPGETATLLARFQPYGIGVLPLSIETPGSAFETAATANLILHSFYSFALSSLALLFMFIVAMRHPGGLNFLALFGCGLIMMAQLDGLLNQWVWPNWPRWNKIASFPMLLALCSAGFATATFMLRTGEKPRLADASQKLALVCFVPLAFIPFVEIAWLILTGFVFMVIAMALLTYAVINWAKFLHGKTRIAIAIGAAIFLLVGLILIDVLTGQGNLAAQNLALVKVLYAVITLSIMLSYATHVAALNQEHAIAVKRELELARNEARISADLLESERRYAHAQDLVTRQRSRLANASHDLRQPITSLRLTLDAITRKADGSVDENVTRAFDYLDDLVSNHLVETREEEEQQASDGDDAVEVIAASLITGTIAEMFAEEAAAKGLRFKHVESAATVRVSPMPVMRIVSNLVSNAVKHTESGGVLIGSRPRGDRIAFVVVDTGPGMSAEDLEILSERYEKGESSQGHGLGLAICYELAAAHGYEITARSRPSHGTRYILSVPSPDGPTESVHSQSASATP